MPSTARFSCCWKARTAASVFGPKMPSTVTLCPRVRSRYCKLGTGCFWSPFFVSGQGLIVPETMSAPFTEARPESESVIAHVDTSDSRWASATARSRLTDTDQNGGSPLQASGFGGSGAFATGTSASETSDPGTSGIRYRIGSRRQRTPFGSIHSIAPSSPRRQDQAVKVLSRWCRRQSSPQLSASVQPPESWGRLWSASQNQTAAPQLGNCLLYTSPS